MTYNSIKELSSSHKLQNDIYFRRTRQDLHPKQHHHAKGETNLADARKHRQTSYNLTMLGCRTIFIVDISLLIWTRKN